MSDTKEKITRNYTIEDLEELLDKLPTEEEINLYLNVEEGED